MKKHILILCISAFVLGILNASPMAVIVHSKGFNKVRRDGKNLRAVSGMILQDGDELKTSGKGQLGIKTADGEGSLFLFSKTKVKLNLSPIGDGWEKNVELLAGSIHVKNTHQTGSLSLSFGLTNIFFTDADLLFKKDKGSNARLTVFSGEAIMYDREGGVNKITSLKTSYILSKGEFISRWMNDSDLTEEERARIEPLSQLPQNRITIPLTDEQGRVLNVEFNW